MKGKTNARLTVIMAGITAVTVLACTILVLAYLDGCFTYTLAGLGMFTAAGGTAIVTQ